MKVAISYKVARLCEYLAQNGFEIEAAQLTLLAADKTEALGTEVAPISRSRVWLSEKILQRQGIIPINYLAGTEALARGEGTPSAEGNVYEVEYNGRRAIAKIVHSSNSEPSIWKKIMGLDIPLKYQKHLPKIYDIINTEYNVIIIMEVLEPIAGHMAGVLRGTLKRDKETLMKNEDFIHEVITRSVNHVLSNISDAMGEDEQRTLMAEAEAIASEVEGAVFRKDQKIGELEPFLYAILDKYTKDEEMLGELSSRIDGEIASYMNVAERPVAKYFSPKSLEYTMTETRNQKKRDRIQNELDSYVYEDSEERYLYPEKYMEETSSLYDLLNILKDNGIQWSDLHSRNLMLRPGTRDLVIIDVSLYNVSL